MNLNSLFNRLPKVGLLDLNKSKELLSFYSHILLVIIPLCVGNRRKLFRYISRSNRFIQRIIRMNRCNGSAYTIKYMKASTAALQRYLGGIPLCSMRDIEPDYSFPGLVGGLPSLIPWSDRRAIKEGSISVIRLWVTLFNLYRVLKAPLKPKLNTITDPYSGDPGTLDLMVNDFESFGRTWLSANPTCPPMDINRLSPTKFFKTSKASANSKLGWAGPIPDLLAWVECKGPIRALLGYLFYIASPFGLSLKQAYDLLDSLNSNDPNRFTTLCGKFNSYKGVMGRLAFKEEAAGKLRIFAIADYWTQFVLSPLHRFLFDVLQAMPNDGTFDQDKSVWRGSDKMLQNKVAFSYDLSAATDRLPIRLQTAILNSMFPGVGDFWQTILIERKWEVLPNSYGVPEGPVSYSVGQPMGALSSWAMLAITHHLIVQYSARSVYSISFGNRGYWFSEYELLGDDIVIFDTNVASFYLEVMKNLGVEINLSKSILSPSGKALEFAKRTIYAGHDVSPLPWKLFRSVFHLLSGKISLLLTLRSRKWPITMHRLLACLDSRASKRTLWISQSEFWETQGPIICISALRSWITSPGLIIVLEVVTKLPGVRFPAFHLMHALESLDVRSFAKLVLKTCTNANVSWKFMVDNRIPSLFFDMWNIGDKPDSDPIDYTIKKACGVVDLDSDFSLLESITPDSNYSLDRAYHFNTMVGYRPGEGRVPRADLSFETFSSIDHGILDTSTILDRLYAETNEVDLMSCESEFWVKTLSLAPESLTALYRASASPRFIRVGTKVLEKLVVRYRYPRLSRFEMQQLNAGAFETIFRVSSSILPKGSLANVRSTLSSSGFFWKS